jgi:hypothetical protein
MASGSLEARRCSRGRCHGTTAHRLGEWHGWGCASIIVVSGSWVIGVGTVIVVIGTIVFHVGCLPLAIIKVLLVERSDPVGTLLGVVSRVVWWQRAHPESQTASIPADIMGVQGFWCLLWKFRQLGILSWCFFVHIGSMDIDGRDHQG